jgi:vesicle coat complex subunit
MCTTSVLMSVCLSVYDVSGAASDRNCVVLSDIHIDIMDYIQPASCTDAEFRQMWAEFEWENKVLLLDKRTVHVLLVCSVDDRNNTVYSR